MDRLHYSSSSADGNEDDVGEKKYVSFRECRVVLTRIDDENEDTMEVTNNVYDEEASLSLIPSQKTVSSHVPWLPQNVSQTQNESDAIQICDGATPNSVPMEMFVKVKLENEASKTALKKVNMCLGDQTVPNDSTSSIEDDEYNYNEDNPVNTRHYQIDSLFAPKYYYITNVSWNRF